MERYSEYVKSGLGFAPVPKIFIWYTAVPLLLTFFVGYVPGRIIGGLWADMAKLMIFICLSALVLTVILSLKKLTTRVRLLIQLIMNLEWIVILCLIETLFFYMLFGLNVYIIFLYLPVVLIPLTLGEINAVKLKRNTYKLKNQPV